MGAGLKLLGLSLALVGSLMALGLIQFLFLNVTPPTYVLPYCLPNGIPICFTPNVSVSVLNTGLGLAISAFGFMLYWRGLR